jgi:hypothetical protein
MLEARTATLGLVVAWCLLAGADAGAPAGYYNHIALLAAAVGFVVVAVVAAFGVEPAPVSRPLIALPVLVCLGFAIDDPTRPFWYQHGDRLFAIESMQIAVAAAVVVLFLVRGRLHPGWWWMTAAVAVATGVVVITLIRNPGIDVWDLLQQSSTGLLHGDDMYRQHWTGSTGLQAVYPYLPLTTVLLAPFRWLFLDVRFGLLAAIVVTAWLLRRSDRNTGPLLSCLLLATPGWVLLVDRSWTEPLLLLLLAVAVLGVRSGRTAAAVIALGAALACKQHVWLLLPVFATWPAFGLRRAVTSAAFAAAAMAPWLIAGSGDLWHDAVHANLALGSKRSALSVPSFLLRHGHHVGLALAAGLVAAAYLLSWLRIRRTPAGLAMACALVLWAFDLGNRQTYFNHYQLPLGLLVVALAVVETGQANACSGTPSRRGRTGAERPVPV